PQALDAIKNGPRILRSAQASFPGPGHAVEDGGDPVGDGLSIAFQERNFDRKSDPRPRHHLSFECIAVDVDDPGENQEAVRIDCPLGRYVRADVADDSLVAIQMNAGVLETALDECATSFDARPHDRSGYERAVCSVRSLD